MNRLQDFQDRLLAAEQITPTFRQRYEKEVQAMLEKTLTPGQRVGFGFAAIMNLAFFVIFGYVAAIGSDLPALIRAAFAAGSVFGLVGALIVGKIFLQGKMNRRFHPNTITGLAWGFVIILVTVFMLVTGRQPDETKSVYMVVSGLVYLVFAAVFMIVNRIDQAQIKTEEQFLEIKLRLAELAEKAGPNPQ